MLEFEKKMILTKKEYTALMALSPEAETVTQTNYYYDTDFYDMDLQGITCRIREKGGKYTATIKEHSRDSLGCSSETSQSASGPFDTALFRECPVKLRGSMMTYRTYLLKEEGFEMVLDRNCYLDTEDYEMEIEYAPQEVKRTYQTLSAVASLLGNMQQEKTGDTAAYFQREKEERNKAHRFFNRLRTLQCPEGSIK